jgi:hypothetical protein
MLDAQDDDFTGVFNDSIEDAVGSTASRRLAGGVRTSSSSASSLTHNARRCAGVAAFAAPGMMGVWIWLSGG